MATREPLSELPTPLDRLSAVQTALKAPKSQRNTFGNYNYRNCEDILEAVKPLLAENQLTLVLSDELVNVGDRYYVKSTAAVLDSGVDKELLTEVTAYAREEETKKGMDGSQITGASSSYARKYALNGLFLIDDTKDSDATNEHGKSAAPKQTYTPPSKPTEPAKPGLVNPASMATLRALLKNSEMKGDEVTNYCTLMIGKDKPESESEVQTLIASLEAK